MPEINLGQPRYIYILIVLANHLQKTKKEYKNSKKQET